jgi:peroxiredoxin
MTEYNYSKFEASHYDFLSFPGPKVGEEFPELTFTGLDGDEIKFSSFRGQRVVLESGSLTCPMYAKDVSKMQLLAEQYPDTRFLLMYIREAHPGSKVAAHRTADDKAATARRLQDTFGENRQILIDNVAGTAHQLLGSFPNLTYLIDEQGVVIWRTSWSDAESVEAVLNGSASPSLLAHDIVPPTRPTPWSAARVLLRAGLNSLWDFTISLPRLMRSHGDVRRFNRANDGE